MIIYIIFSINKVSWRISYLSELCLLSRYVLIHLSAHKRLNERISGLSVERERILKTRELGALLDKSLLETVSVCVEEALDLLETRLHHLTLTRRQVALARTNRLAAQ